MKKKKEAIISLILSRDWANTLRRLLNKDLDYRWTDSPCTDKLCIKHFPSVTASSHDKDLQIQAAVNKYPWLKGNLWVQRVSGKRKTKQPLGCCWLVADKLPSGWCNKLGLTKAMYVCVYDGAHRLLCPKKTGFQVGLGPCTWHAYALETIFCRLSVCACIRWVTNLIEFAFKACEVPPNTWE